MVLQNLTDFLLNPALFSLFLLFFSLIPTCCVSFTLPPSLYPQFPPETPLYLANNYLLVQRDSCMKPFMAS